MFTIMPFPFSSGTEQSSQAGWLSLTFFCQKRALSGDTMVVSQAEMSKDGVEQGVETCERDL